MWANKKALKSEAERDIIKEQIRQDILNEKYPLSLNIGNQNKHILTSHSYKNEGSKSYILGDLNTAQELVNKYHGTGEIRLNGKNQWIKKEFVTVDYDIGMIVDRETRKETATNRFSIHYSNSKGTHIVPAERKSKK